MSAVRDEAVFRYTGANVGFAVVGPYQTILIIRMRQTLIRLSIAFLLLLVKPSSSTSWALSALTLLLMSSTLSTNPW